MSKSPQTPADRRISELFATELPMISRRFEEALDARADLGMVEIANDLAQLANDLLLFAVRNARTESNESWENIGDALDMSRQAAWERFSKLV